MKMLARDILACFENDVDSEEKRRLECLEIKDTGTWLAATPNFSCGTALSFQDFMD